MTSSLKWRAGFGWGTLVLIGLGIGLVLGTEGSVRLVGAVVTLVAGAYAMSQYRKWNGSPWRQVHFRGMLLYSRFAGEHAGMAEMEGRPFDKVAACRELALTMCGPATATNVDAMIEALVAEQGRYLASLLRARAPDLFERIDPPKIDELLRRTEALEFGPTLVLCNIVENSYGEAEAARYAYAICSGDAN